MTIAIHTLSIGRNGYITIPAELVAAAGFNTRPHDLFGCIMTAARELVIAALWTFRRSGGLASVLISVKKDGTLTVAPEAYQALPLEPYDRLGCSIENRRITLHLSPTSQAGSSASRIKGVRDR